MFGELDHVGMIVRDLEAATAGVRASLGVPVARTATIEAYGVEAVFLGGGSSLLELFTLADTALSEARLAGAEQRLDHVAYRVEDLDSLARTLRATGVRFCGPDRVDEIEEPIDLGGVRHLWTLPQSSGDVALQLSQPPAR